MAKEVKDTTPETPAEKRPAVDNIVESSVRLTKPKGADGPPPSHEETLGAIAGAPPEIAGIYSRTGKTPTGEWREGEAKRQKDGK